MCAVTSAMSPAAVVLGHEAELGVTTVTAAKDQN